METTPIAYWQDGKTHCTTCATRHDDPITREEDWVCHDGTPSPQSLVCSKCDGIVAFEIIDIEPAVGAAPQPSQWTQWGWGL